MVVASRIELTWRADVRATLMVEGDDPQRGG